MFEDSTKAIIVSSSHTKGIGPRVGSVGYVVSGGTNTSKFLPQQTQFINGLALFALRMIYIRYGYEKERPKYEIKSLIGAIPIVNELRKNSESENIVRTCIEKLPKNDFNSHMWLKAKLDLLGKTDNVNVCILAPINSIGSDLRTCSNLEFEAWFKSLMFQEQTKISIKRIVNNKAYIDKLPNKKIKYISESIRYYLRSKENNDTFMEYILDRKDRREDLIKFVRIIKPIYSNKTFLYHTESMSRLLIKDGYIYKRGSRDINTLFCKLVNYMFIDNILNWKLNLLNKSKLVKNRGSIAAKIRKTKEVLESMANEINSK